MSSNRRRRTRDPRRDICYRGCSEAECNCSRCVERAEYFDDAQELAGRYEREDRIADVVWNRG